MAFFLMEKKEVLKGQRIIVQFLIICQEFFNFSFIFWLVMFIFDYPADIKQYAGTFGEKMKRI
jgi:hypothetical protein